VANYSLIILLTRYRPLATTRRHISRDRSIFFFEHYPSESASRIIREPHHTLWHREKIKRSQNCRRKLRVPIHH